MTVLLSLVLALVSAPNAVSPAVSPAPTIAPASVPLVFTRFHVVIDGVAVQGVKSVEGLPSVVIQYPPSAPPNRQLVPGKSKWLPVKLKRGITSDNQIFEWRQAVIDGKIQASRCEIDATTDNNVVVEYTLHRCWPSRYEGSHLHAPGSAATPETVWISFDSVSVK
jgi:phage tail-like protein